MTLHTHSLFKKSSTLYRILAITILIFNMLLSAPFISVYADETTSNSSKFSDVAEDAWYAADVYSMVEAGVINGMSDGTFNPTGELTVSAAIKLAVAARTTYYKESAVQIAPNSDHWVDSYYNYAEDHGLFKSITFKRSDFDKPITRGQMAALFANVLDSSDYTVINDINNADNPLIRNETNEHAKFLYNRGILIGSDNGFALNTNISRAETAAIIHRVVNPSVRKDTNTLGSGTEVGSGSVEETGDYTFSDYQLETLQLVNDTRAELGLEPLQLDVDLCKAADQLALEYSQGSKVHKRLDGRLTYTVLKDLGLRTAPDGGPLAIKENYSWSNMGNADTASVTHNSWLNSDGHRKEIVSKNHKYIGVSRVQVGADVYWVEVFSPN